MLRKLRVVVVVGALLLVAVVVGFVWYGRSMALRFKLDLPKKLGLDISSSSHHVTLSRSVKGKTVFTVRAADQVQRTNGMIELHDVGIELYGRQDGGTDRISGQDFLFDQKKQVMTGVGDVFIDLAAPAKGAKPMAGGTAAGGMAAAKTVHVKTSGLVFNQAEQTAVTENRIEFMAGGMSGTAVGAVYDAKSGTVELRNQVHVSGLQGERPVVVTASWAELKRTENLVLLTGAKYTTLGAGGGESIAADHAEVRITSEGQPQRVEGQGHVVLSGPERGTMTGDRMELALTEAGKPRTGRVWGGVRYGYDGGGKKAAGMAKEVRVAFDGAGQPSHATAEGGVTFEETVPDETRGLTAEVMEVNFVAAGKGKALPKDAVATGHAVMRSTGVNAKGKTATEVSGDTLTAQFVRVGKKDEVRTLDGNGHTVVHQVAANGVEETSKGSTLRVQFKPGGTGASAIQRAVQQGGVAIVRSTPAVGKTAASVERAAGNEAVYDGVGDKVTVTGGVQVADATSVLLADQVEMLRAAGDATAEGNVRVSYVQEDGKGEPVHITASRAVEKRAAGTADFYGVAGKDARMWQEGSQVQAPVISFSQTGKDKGSRKMVARGGDGDMVKAVLVGASSSGAKGKDGGSGGPVKIVGHEMTYLEAARTVEVDGKVRVQDADGVMTAQKAVAYLTETKAGVAAVTPAAGLMGGRVEKVVATGAVEVSQPGRKGTGEQLVYTAGNKTFVLTGTQAAPPKVVDDARGTTTGAVLRFRSGDDSVVISGREGGQKVRSDTKVKQ